MKLGIVTAVVLGLGSQLAGTPVAAAEPLLIVPGAGYADLDPMIPYGPAFETFYTHAADIGKGFYPDATPKVIDYPASILLKGTVAKHVTAGTDRLDAAIKQLTGPAIIAGQSQGTVSLNEEQLRLLNDPNAPAADQLTFTLFSDPLRGIINTLFKPGTKIPFIGLTANPPVESQYNTNVIKIEYDLWGDTPDRPWNLIAMTNALFAASLSHAWASFPPSIIPPENITVTTNALGGTTTTYLVPTTQLPINEPLRLMHLPTKLVDALDNWMRPMIDSGYSRNDAPGSTKPYMYGGVIHKGASPAAATPVAAKAAAPVAAAVSAPKAKRTAAKATAAQARKASSRN